MPVQVANLSANINRLQLDNQQVPNEGTKALALPLLDFTQANSFALDLLTTTQTGQISMVQNMFIDMSTSDQPMQVTINGSQQVIVAKGRTQGYYCVLCPTPIKLLFSCPGGPGLDPTTGRSGIRVWLINVPIPGVVWPTL